MSEKKLKTGDVVCWAVVDDEREFFATFDSRAQAREVAGKRGCRIAKVVLAK